MRFLRHPGQTLTPGVRIKVGEVRVPDSNRSAVGRGDPSSTLSRVDFPHPLGPVNARTSPGSTVSESASSAWPSRPG